MQSCASETRSPEGDSKRMSSMDSFVLRYGRQIAHHQVIALLALQHLAYRFAANRGFNSVLNVSHIQTVSSCLLTVHSKLEVGLADHAKQAEVRDAGDGVHYVDYEIAGGLERLQIVAVDLNRELPFDAADGLLHVVGNGLREIPQGAGDLFELTVHGGNQFFFIFVEDRAPLLLGLEIDEVLGIEKPVVSVPSSGRPTWLTTCVTSGKDARINRA